MSGFIPDWRIELIKISPKLFHPVDGPLRAEGMPYVYDGWRDLIEHTFVRIRAAVLADGGTFRFSEIKEKYGIAADGRRFVTCRRYDRQNDVFVDVDPATLGIEED
jgi:hypothetical protein